MTVTTLPNLVCLHTFDINWSSQVQHQTKINAVAISRDRTEIAAVGICNQSSNDAWAFTVWNLASQKSFDVAKRISRRSHKAEVSSVAFSMDSRSIAIASLDATSDYHPYPSLSFWNLETLPDHTVQHPEGGGR